MLRSTILLSFVLVLAAGQAAAQRAVPGQPELVSAPQYDPPAEAIAAGIDGTLLIYTAVNERGEVSEARAIAGPQWPCGDKPSKLIDEVRRGAEAAVRQAKFTPAMKDGKPADSVTGVRVWLGRAYEAMLKKRAAEGKPAEQLIKGGVLNGRALFLAKPAYPMAARQERLSGTVTVGVLIDEAGKVIAAGAETGHPLLQEGARESACKSKFSPTKLEGKPVKVSGVITYNFVAP